MLSHCANVSVFGWTVQGWKLVMSYGCKRGIYTGTRGAVLPLAKHVHVANDCSYDQAAALFGYRAKSGLFCSLVFRLWRSRWTGTLLCVVLSSACMLAVCPFVWRSFLFMLDCLSAWYFMMRHLNAFAWWICDANCQWYDILVWGRGFSTTFYQPQGQ